MGLFDTITNALGGGSGQQGADENGGLGGLLRQGGAGASSGIIGQRLAGVGGGQGAGSQGIGGQGMGGQGVGGQSGYAQALGGQGGGMASMLETLAANGLGQEVSSWMSNNPNLPVSPQQIHDALGSQQVQQLAQSTGLPVGDFLRHLAEHLPTAASQAAGTNPS